MIDLTIKQEERLQEVLKRFTESEAVKAIDTADGEIKESRISAVYADYVVVLSELIQSDVHIDNLILD